jgi:methyl-accepting chemotaxis protein
VRWTIGRRLTAVGVVAISAAVGVGLIGALQTSSSSDRADHAFAVSSALATVIDAQHTASVVLADASILTHALSADRRPEVVDQMTEHAGELAEQVEDLQAVRFDEELNTALDEFLPTAGPVLDDATSLAQTPGRVSQTRFETARQHWDGLDEASDGLKTLLSEASARNVRDTEIGNARTQTTLWIVTAVSALLLSGLVWRVSRLVAPPIANTKRLLEDVAGGNFTGRVAVRTDDDLGDMGRALNATVENVGQAIREISGQVRILGDSARDLTAVSQQVAGGAQRTSAEAGAASAGATEVQTDMQAIAGGTDQMRGSIQEIARNASAASEIVSGAVGAAQGATQTVSKLAKSSDQIGQVARTIAAIAEQTNLLALNATIEAARAGELGKGFAVVAGEVKDLATETARATEDIARRIASLQADSADVASVIDEISATINQIAAIQQVIGTAVEEQSASTGEIGNSVARAAERTTNIADRVAAVTLTAQDATDSAARTEQAATALDTTAGQLRGIVDQFRFAAPVKAAVRS